MVPPIVEEFGTPSMEMPVAFASLVVPLTSVPIRLPWMTLFTVEVVLNESVT